jgi:serine/threonine protein kinase
VLNDIVKLHRDAAADYDQTTMGPAATHAAASPAPDTWGKYRLTTNVGEGSYGSVYRAWDSELERDVAIKILHRRVGDTKLRERLLQKDVRSPRSSTTTSCACLVSRRKAIASACAWSSCAGRRSPTSCAVGG